MSSGPAMHGNQNLPKAQAIKDATMAHFILENWEKGKTFIHYNGSYHSDNFEGIVWYLKQENPNLYIDEKYYAQTSKFEKEYKAATDKTCPY